MLLIGLFIIIIILSPWGKYYFSPNIPAPKPMPETWQINQYTCVETWMNERRKGCFSWGRERKENKQAQGPHLMLGLSKDRVLCFLWGHSPATHPLWPVVTHANTGSDWFFKWGSRLVVAQNKPLYDPVIPLLSTYAKNWKQELKQIPVHARSRHH